MKNSRFSSIKIKLSFFFVLFICAFYCNALPYQINDIDSLKQASKNLEEKEKIRCYNIISELYWYLNIDSSIYYANMALQLAKKTNDVKGQAHAYNNLGGAYTHKGDNFNTLKYYNFSLDLSIKLGLKKSESNLLHNLSSIYSAMGIYDKAIDYNNRALKISLELNNAKGVALAYLVNSYCYRQQQMPEKAQFYNFQALTIFRKLNDTILITSTLDDIGSTYNVFEKTIIAKYYLTQGLKIALKSNDYYMCGTIYNNLGISFFIEKNFDSAQKYHYRAIEYFQKLKSENTVGPYINLARLNLKINKTDSAKYYLDKAYILSNNRKNLQVTYDIFILYTDYYKKIKEPYQALVYVELSSQIKESMQSEKNINKLLDMQLDLVKEKHRAEKEIQDLKIKRNQNQRNLSIIISVLVLVLLGLLYSRYNNNIRINKLLSEKNDALNLANQTKDKFFTIISHDIKNQLIAFQNISQVLSENFADLNDDKKLHLATKINHAADSLFNVLENLLIWSSAQMQGFEYEPKLFNIKQLAEEICDEFALQSDKKRIKITNNLEHETFVVADENMTRDVLRNLVNNSIKYSNEESEVIISGKISNKMIEISVTDHGIGISESDQQKLFRLDVNHKEIGNHREKGSGLGLIIVKEFVEKMNGNIWIDSKEGIGSTFTFSLHLNN